MSSELIVRCYEHPREPENRRDVFIEKALESIGPIDSSDLYCSRHVSICLAHLKPAGGLYPFWIVDPNRKVVVAGLTNGAENAKRTEASVSEVGGLQSSLPDRGAEQASLVIETLSDGSGVVLHNDGTGFIPVYYAVLDSGDMAICTRLRAMGPLGVPFEFDLIGVAEYLTYLHPLGDRTLISGVQCLPPGSLAIWSRREGLHIRSKSIFSYPSPYSHGRDSLEDVLAMFGDVWNRTMNQLASHMDGRLALSLSGGLDSRNIANGLVDIGFKPRTFTFGDRYLREVRIAGQVASRTGLEHTVFPVRPQNMLANAYRILDSLDGTHSPFECYVGWFADDLSPLAKGIVQGTSADVFWGTGSCEESITSIESIKSLIADRYQAANRYMQTFLEPDFAQLRNKSLEQGLTKSLEVYKDISAADAMTMWNIDNRQRRWGIGGNAALYRLGIDFTNPYFFKPFLEFAERIPTRLRYKGVLHAVVQNTYFKRTADIIYVSNLLEPVHFSDGAYSKYKGWKTKKDLIRKDFVSGIRFVYNSTLRNVSYRMMLRPIRPTRFPGPWRQEQPVYRHHQWIRENPTYRRRYLDLFEDALSSVPDCLSRANLNSALDAIHSRDADLQPPLLGRLINLCLWHKRWKVGSVGNASK